MSLKNWKLTINLLSPLAGDPPALDSILEYELAFRLGYKHAKKLTRDIPLSDIEKIPIPICKKTIDGIDVYRCSNPIASETIFEWTEKHTKRFDTSSLSLSVQESQRKALLVASGPYKMRFTPTRVRLIKKVVYFFRGDRKEVRKLLKSIKSLGQKRGLGYGIVDCFEFEQQEKDISIMTKHQGKNILMKTVPLSYAVKNKCTGYKKTFGGGFPPYWHPETFMEIAVPC